VCVCVCEGVYVCRCNNLTSIPWAVRLSRLENLMPIHAQFFRRAILTHKVGDLVFWCVVRVHL